MQSNQKANFVALAYILTFLILAWIIYQRVTSQF